MDIDIVFVAQIEAHAGSVNDLAFSYPNKQLCVVTCGEDRVIKVGLPYIFNRHAKNTIFKTSMFTGMGCSHWCKAIYF